MQKIQQENTENDTQKLLRCFRMVH